ncbi:MAG: ABC transporter ATP-binding protein/permease [Gammaproteobacteria bacterium]|nr:ABC transporter ATP-binding protein/permease [Gammaproteobacteria bacterium]
MAVHRYTEAPHEQRNDFGNIKRIIPYIWQYKGRVLIALASLMLAKLATVGVPLVLKDIVDALDKDLSTATLPLMLLLAYGALRAGNSLFNELRDAIFARVRYGAMRKLSHQVIQHLYSLSLRFHLERQTGGISRDLERGTNSVSSILNYLVFNILPTAAEFTLVAIILLGKYEIVFTIVTFSTVAIYVAFTIMVTNWRMHYRHKMNRLDSQANSMALDGLINYETVKYFNNEQLEVSRYDSTLTDWENAAVKSQTSMSLLNFGQGFIIAIGVTLIMIYATQGVLKGSMSLGDLVLVNTMMLQLFMPLGFLGIIYRMLRHSLADMDLLFKLMDTQNEIKDRPGAKAIEIHQGAVEFDHVSFHYKDDRAILKDINFHIPAGHKVAVVGPSGAGKSTLSRLLYRFYDVIEGSIRVDGQDLRDVTQDSLRRTIGIVPQDTVLFNDTIYHNIAYAREGATRDEVEHAARLANIHDFIEGLPDKYETIVGERGLKLSGGEKQRVAIARVILKSPPLLIFDEATSSLDSQTEKQINQALRDVAEKRTTLVIAHRLSTIVDADNIIVLQDGRIEEQGTHQQLLERGGLYAEMWALQQEEQQLEKEDHIGAI